MARTSEMKEEALDFLSWLWDHLKQAAALFFGSLFCAFVFVATWRMCYRMIANGWNFEVEDSLRIAILVTALIFGIRMLKATDYTRYLFRRY